MREVFLSARCILLLVHYVELSKYCLVDSNISNLYSNLYFSGWLDEPLTSVIYLLLLLLHRLLPLFGADICSYICIQILI